MLISFLTVSSLSLCVALNLAEICSAYPDGAGSVYIWTSKAAPARFSPLLSYIVGMNILIGTLSSIAVSLIAST
jgi:amino acid permease